VRLKAEKTQNVSTLSTNGLFSGRFSIRRDSGQKWPVFFAQMLPKISFDTPIISFIFYPHENLLGVICQATVIFV
jgi:hypothetical protein